MRKNFLAGATEGCETVRNHKNGEREGQLSLEAVITHHIVRGLWDGVGGGAPSLPHGLYPNGRF